MASFIAEELISRGHTLIDNTTLAQISKSLKMELARITEHLVSFNESQSSLLHNITSEIKEHSTRISMIGVFEKNEILSIREKLGDSIQKLESLSSGKSRILTFLASLDQLLTKLDSAHISTSKTDPPVDHL